MAIVLAICGVARLSIGEEEIRLSALGVFIVLLSEVALVYAYSTRESSSPPAPTRFWVLQLPSVLRVATLFALYGALSPLWTAYRSTLSRVDKRRLLYLIGVGALSITAAALDYLPSPLGRGGPAIGSLLTIVYLYFLQQTLVMDRLLDINELLGRVVVLSAFVLLLSAVQTLLTLIGVQPQQVVTVVAFVSLAVAIPLVVTTTRIFSRHAISGSAPNPPEPVRDRPVTGTAAPGRP